MAARAGFQVRLKASGAGVSMTAEATTAAGNIVYTITNTAKRVLDPTAAITVKNGGTPTVEAYTLNRLKGTITFGSASARTITVDGTYLPMTAIAEGTDVEITCVANNADDSSFGDVDCTRLQISKDWSGSVGRWYSTDTYFMDAFAAAAPWTLEGSFDSGTTVVFRGWAFPTKVTQGGTTKTLVTDGISFEGKADADGRSFTWLE